MLLAGLLAGLIPPAVHAGSLGGEELQLLQGVSPDSTVNAKGRELAQKLGREASVDGLEAIVQGVNEFRLSEYAYGFSSAWTGYLPASMETLIVRHFDSKRNQRYVFMRMIGEGRAKYRTKEMFDTLHRALEVEMNGEHFRVARSVMALKALVRTDLSGVEAALVELLPRLPRDTTRGDSWAAHEVALRFLAERKHAPAAAYVVARLPATEPAESENASEAVMLLSTLAAIDPAAFRHAALARIEQLSKRPRTFAVDVEMNVAFGHLQRQRVAFTVPQLAAWLAGTRANDRLAAAIVGELVRMQDAGALDAIIDRIAWGAGQSPPIEIASLLWLLGGVQDQTLLDYRRLKAVLPAQLSDGAVGAHVRLIGRRADATADLLPYVAHPAHGGEALRLILDSKSVDLWRQARDHLEHLKNLNRVDSSLYMQARAQLDRAIADPQGHADAKKQRARAIAFEEERYNLAQAQARDRSAPDSPAWAETMRAWIAGAEQLERKYADVPAVAELRADLRRRYGELAIYARRVQKQPAEAIRLYEVVGQYDEATGTPRFLTELLMADTYRFDLQAPQAAIARYEAAAAALASATSDRHAAWNTSEFLTRWLRHEIAYLRTGTRFSGQVTQDEALAALLPLVHLVRAEAGRPMLPQSADALEQLAPSHFSLPTLMRFIGTLSEDDVLRHLKKHDPSGYWTACLMASVLYVQRMSKAGDVSATRAVEALMPGVSSPGSGLRRASERFLRDQKVSVHFPLRDPRKSSPEGTWSVFVATLGQADLERAYACLTPDLKRRLEPALSGMPAGKLKEMAESFADFATTARLGGVREAFVRRGNRAGFVYFQELNGEWLISEM